LTAIRQWHDSQGLMDPTHHSLVKKTMEGIRRLHSQPKKKAKALRLEDLITMLSYLNEGISTHKKRRDKALLLIGFFSAFRRSELVGIQVSDLSWETEGLIIHLPRSKTDQQSTGLSRAIPFAEPSICPVRAMKIWLDTAQITQGSVFRSINRWDHIASNTLPAAAINELLKKLGQECHFNFALELSSHSFRRGLSTSAAREKIDFQLIKKQGGWKNDATVWEYIETGQAFNENASGLLLTKMAHLIPKKKNE
jgi:integrase